VGPPVLRPQAASRDDSCATVEEIPSAPAVTKTGDFPRNPHPLWLFLIYIPKSLHVAWTFLLKIPIIQNFNTKQEDSLFKLTVPMYLKTWHLHTFLPSVRNYPHYGVHTCCY
jgi:hypothetical protein